RGAAQLYRIIDFKRNKKDVPGKVAQLEYDPNRNVDIALINYADGEKRYILAPEGLKAGMTVLSSDKAEIAVGNTLPLQNIPLGMKVHSLEINIGAGGVLVRGAGTYGIIMAKEGDYVNIKLPSGEVKKFLNLCRATIGELGNADHRHTRDGKAGIKRHKGFRPAVRGVAMGVHSHPHGGSYRDNGIGMPFPKTPWGKNTRGKKTRSRSHTNKYIVTKRGSKR
ncbi:50S ribosomal protein L2, partial [Patescibacteria group bacterium]|nr:50S ribosomal protein L2 [Patescibacteria group bacterium]